MSLGFTDSVHVNGHLSDDVVLEHGSFALELLKPENGKLQDLVEQMYCC